MGPLTMYGRSVSIQAGILDSVQRWSKLTRDAGKSHDQGLRWFPVR